MNGFTVTQHSPLFSAFFDAARETSAHRAGTQSSVSRLHKGQPSPTHGCTIGVAETPRPAASADIPAPAIALITAAAAAPTAGAGAAIAIAITATTDPRSTTPPTRPPVDARHRQRFLHAAGPGGRRKGLTFPF